MRILLMFFLSIAGSGLLAQHSAPLRLGVVGLSHDHVHGILGRPGKGDIEIVGFVENDQALIERLSKRYQLDSRLIFSDLEEMLEAQKPEAVSVFSSIYDHTEITEICARKGVHVMVEKPLAVNLEHARRMEKAASEGGIQLITNYETTWYPSNHKAYDLVHTEKALGDIRKIVVHDGHPGPREIGCSEEFLAWLTDPVQNGGGAIIDFGCYGADLATWLMKGDRPASVMAVTQQIKPDVYPHVDDEATIIVTYPKAQAIIQASWNWPVGRKDMHVYGRTGYVKTINARDMLIRRSEKEKEEKHTEAPFKAPDNDAFSWFAGVVRGDIDPAGTLGSLEINMVAMEILDAAVRSAKSGEKIILDKD